MKKWKMLDCRSEFILIYLFNIFSPNVSLFLRLRLTDAHPMIWLGGMLNEICAILSTIAFATTRIVSMRLRM